MPKHSRAGLVGVTGYTGMELVRLMAGHPSMELVRVTSRSEAGKPLSDIYPFLRSLAVGDLEISQPDPKDLAQACDIVFLAVPHKTAMEMAAALVRENVRVIDLSADFRLNDQSVYETWYETSHTQPALLQDAVYGLPELNAARIATARLVANPGCYPTSAILGLAPALGEGLIDTNGIVVDSKSGTSGAGRGARVGSLFCEVHDSFRAYGVGTHRHTPEIEQECSKLANSSITLSFCPHLLPIDRGILSTIHTSLAPGIGEEQVRAAYEQFYADKPYVRVLPHGELPETRFVRGTLFCDIGLVVEPRTKRLIIISAIDNLCRGASGQALANANLMSGLPLETGLPKAPMMP